MRPALFHPRPTENKPVPNDDWGSLFAAFILIIIVIGLLAFGLTMVYSTTAPKSGEALVIKQGMWAGIGIVMAVITVFIGPKRIADWRLIFLSLFVVWGLLLAARFLFPPINGAYRWVQLPGISLQPSELAKFVGIVLFARWSFDQLRTIPSILKESVLQLRKLLCREGDQWYTRTTQLILGFCLIGVGGGVVLIHGLEVWRFVISAVFILPGLLFIAASIWVSEDYNPMRFFALTVPPVCFGITLGLIFMGKDLGMTALTAASAGAIIFVAGIRMRWIIMLLMLAFGGLQYLCSNPDSFRYKRLLSFRNPEAAGDAGFQIWMSLLALGSGGLLGRGLGEGRMKTGYLPEDHTDCILSIAGEELGFIALVCVILFFILLLCAAAYITMRANNKCSMLLGTGFTAMLGLQMLINIAVITSSMPAKGMPAPFISYGGSDMVVSLMAIGVIVGIAIESAFPHFHDGLFAKLSRYIPFISKP